MAVLDWKSGYIQPDETLIGELNGISQEIDKYLSEPGHVANQISGNLRLDLIANGEALARSVLCHHVQ